MAPDRPGEGERMLVHASIRQSTSSQYPELIAGADSASAPAPCAKVARLFGGSGWLNDIVLYRDGRVLGQENDSVLVSRTSSTKPSSRKSDRRSRDKLRPRQHRRDPRPDPG